MKILCPDHFQKRTLCLAMGSTDSRQPLVMSFFRELLCPSSWDSLHLGTEWGRDKKSWPFGVLFSRVLCQIRWYFGTYIVLLLSLLVLCPFLLFTSIDPNDTTCFQSFASPFASKGSNLWHNYFVLPSCIWEKRDRKSRENSSLCLLETRDVNFKYLLLGQHFIKKTTSL